MVAVATDQHDDDDMAQLKLARMTADFALLLAKRRADRYVQFSPSWDAAMMVVEACEREAYRLDQVALERVASSN